MNGKRSFTGKDKNGDNNSDSSKAEKLKFEAEIKAKDLIIENLQKELTNAKERIKFLEQEQQRWNDKEIVKTNASPEYDVIVLSSDSEEDDLDDDSSGISDTEDQEVKLASLNSEENVKASSKPAAKILDSEEENEEDEMESESQLNLEESNAKNENKNNSLKLVEKLCFEEEEELDSDEDIFEDEPESEEEETSDSGKNATTKTIKIKTLSMSSSEEEEDELNSEEENLDSSGESEEDDPLCTKFIVPTSEEEEESDEDETVSEEDESDSELNESNSEEEDDAIDNKIKKRKVIESSDSENHESDSKENIDIKPSLKRFKIEQSSDSWPHQMDTKMLIKQEPNWLLSQSYCNFLYRSHSDNEEEFLKACIKKLFNVGERILPENRLDIQKKNEALKIMAHYFMETKMEHHQNHMYRILGKFRQYDRQHFYKKVTSKKGIIGVCSNGEYFFYSKFGHRYLPCIDGKCKYPLNTILGTFSDKYAIPKKYRYVEFITIIHISDKRRHVYHLLEPATGNLEKHINNRYKDSKK